MLFLKPLQFFFTKNDNKLAGPTIILLGFISSLWAFCIFVVGLLQNHWDNQSTTWIVTTAFLSHTAVVGFGKSFLIYGLIHKDPTFLLPYIGYKVIENVFIFCGSILSVSRYYKPFVGLLPVGIIFLAINGLITMSVWKTYKKMKDNPNPPPSVEGMEILEKPPSYEQFANQI